MAKKSFIGLAFLQAIVTLNWGCVSVQSKAPLGNSMSKENYREHMDLSGKQVLSQCEEQLKQAQTLKDEIIHAKGADFAQTLETYNDLLIAIDRAMCPATLMSQVHPDEKIRKEADSCEQNISRFMTDLSLDKRVFEALAAGEKLDLDPEAKRLVEHTLRDFKRAGVNRDEKTRKRIRELKEELVKIGQEFDENIRSESLAIKLDSAQDLDGLPQDYIAAHPKGPDGKITITTDYPDLIPFMSYAKNGQHRKALHFKFLNRGSKNEKVLRSLLQKRHELAHLLGYSSYADYIVEDKMIKRAANIHSFIDKIANVAKEGADKEYAALLAYKKRIDPKATEIYGYESTYLEEGLKKELFSFDSQAMRPYFPYDSVLKGLLDTTSKLFNIRYEQVHDAKVWDPSVLAYDVFDDQGKLGRVFLDMHPRAGKFQHAAQFTVLSGLKGKQYPEGALVCNFPSPKEGDGSALMDNKQVVTMFHEFGHLLHHIFSGRQQWIPFSGVATEWDFVEAPSQLLEEWSRSAEVLPAFARHYQTNEPVPLDLINKMRAANDFGKALQARQQTFYAALSANYFDKDPTSFEPLDLLKQLQAKYSYYPYSEGTHFNHNFGHLNGYSAMYYTYMWSLIIAKDLFEPFVQKGLMNADIAGRFRDTILRQGGSKDAAVMVEDFLGRPFKLDAFEAWLKKDSMGSVKQSAKK